VTLGEAILVLDRRRNYLEERPESDGGASYNRAEIAALDKALALMQAELVRIYEEQAVGA
jgi:hypothetical protein